MLREELVEAGNGITWEAVDLHQLSILVMFLFYSVTVPFHLYSLNPPPSSHSPTLIRRPWVGGRVERTVLPLTSMDCAKQHRVSWPFAPWNANVYSVPVSCVGRRSASLHPSRSRPLQTLAGCQLRRRRGSVEVLKCTEVPCLLLMDGWKDAEPN